MSEHLLNDINKILNFVYVEFNKFHELFML